MSAFREEKMRTHLLGKTQEETSLHNKADSVVEQGPAPEECHLQRFLSGYNKQNCVLFPERPKR